MIEFVAVSVASSVIGLIGLYMRLKHLERRDQREKERYEFAARQCSDAYYRGGNEGLHAMQEAQVDLLRATAPKSQRGLIDQIRRAPINGPQQLPSRHTEALLSDPVRRVP